MERVLKKTIATFEMIKFSHSIFALPFALGAMVLAARGIPNLRTFLLIVAAMVTARSAAMAFNRLVDASIDAKNPRTENRHIPQKLLSRNFVVFFTGVMSLLFLTLSSQLNFLTLVLCPFVLLFLFSYSFTKRFTSLCHLWLGLALGLAPLAAWVAVTGTWPWPILLLAMAVMFWVAGFDIIYSIQDFGFDKQEGLHSLVTKLGIKNAFRASRAFHMMSVVLLFLFGLQNGLHWPYFVTTFLIGFFLYYEHSLVSENRIENINTAFFTVNGCISFIFLLGILGELRFFP